MCITEDDYNECYEQQGHSGQSVEMTCKHVYNYNECYEQQGHSGQSVEMTCKHVYNRG